MQRYRISFDRVSCKDTFYQCVFMLCDKADPVMQSGFCAKAHFGMEPEDYMPHLSLLYSDMTQPARHAHCCLAATQLCFSREGCLNSAR